jgi:type IV pilus assembly protein PilQ
VYPAACSAVELKEGKKMRSLASKYKASMVIGIVTIIVLTCSVVPILAEEPTTQENSFADRMQKQVSVQFRKTPIEDVARALADQADIDIVMSPNVTGEVTVTLTDVPLEEALKAILTVHQCSYVLDKNLIRVMTAGEQVERPVIMESTTFDIVYADPTQVVEGLKDVMSKEGSVSYIKGTSHVMVTDSESKLKDIGEFIEKIDQPTPQILVEARIYDITCKDRLDLGVEWQAGRNTTYSTTAGLTGIGTNPTDGRDDPFLTSGFQGASTKAETASGVLRMGWLNNSMDVDMLLRAQQENINAKLLANPRILVIDNETATIKIVSQIPYQELQESALGGSVGTTAFREVGVELEVTPHLAYRDGMIRLHLRPVFSVITGEVYVVGQSASYPQPIVDRREADTKLLIRDGQTVVLGGLRKKDVTKQTNKIPVLGDIPLFGKLFRFTGEDTVTSELVVFITPRIVTQPALTPDERRAYEQTKFNGPEPEHTKSEIRAGAQ